MTALKRVSKPSLLWAIRILLLGTGKPLKVGCGPLGWVLKVFLRFYLPYLYYTREGYFVNLEEGKVVSFDVQEPESIEEGLRAWFDSQLVRDERQPIRDILETSNFEGSDGPGYLDYRLWWTFQAVGSGNKKMGNVTIGEPRRKVRKRLVEWCEAWDNQQKPLDYSKGVEEEAKFLDDVEEHRQKRRQRRGALFR